MSKNVLTSVLTALMILINKENIVNGEYMTAKGKILCNGIPIKYAKVKLMDSDIDADDTFGTTRSDENGNFVVSGSASDIWGKPDPYIEVEYYYSGKYGKLEIEAGLFESTADDETKEKSYSTSIDFGQINFNGQKCKTYVNVLNAMIDYYTRTTIKIPVSKLTVELDEILIGSTPYSTDNTIHVPNGYNNDNGLSAETSKHELAHIVRHTYDGSYWHFLSDVITYNYMQYHDCNKNTNHGFAFNEGWAEFWADECTSNTDTTYSIEGNVASALRRLKNKCGSSYNKMIMVLKNNPGQIHSFTQYNDKHYSLYNCKL